MTITALIHRGFTADEIVAGFISADRIEAGTIAVSKLVPNAGTDINISGNTSLASNSIIAPPAFSTTKAYAVGQMVTYNGKIYRFKTAHSAGAWNASHVTETSLGTAIDFVPGMITTTVSDSLGNYYTKTETATQISTAITSNNGNYYTKSETATQISTAITSNNGNYYTKTETASQISTAITNNNGNYYTKTETATQISTAISNNNGNYYTKTETASQITTAITNNNGNYYTKTETATQISTYVGSNAYGKVAGVDITANRVRIYASGSATNYLNISSSGITGNATNIFLSTEHGYNLGIQSWGFYYNDAANNNNINSIYSYDRNGTSIAAIRSFSVDKTLSITAGSYISFIPASSGSPVYIAKLSGSSNTTIYGSNVEVGNGSVYMTAIYGDYVYYHHLSQTSSREVKHDIMDLMDYGDKIDQLRPVSFVYDSDPNEELRSGLIYEETIDIVPEICTSNDDNKAIDYVELIPILLKEIQGLRKRVKDLEEM